MLSHLQISNFTLVEQLELELKSGLTVLTGETGAGKSILLDALSLVLGDRADADKVRHGAERADIQATFHLAQLPHVQNWLKEHEMSGGEECILRRVVTKEGRSRGFINGQAVTLLQLKALGDMLVDIHGQHEHQSLLKLVTHVRLLDEFGQQRPLAKEVKRSYYHWHRVREQLNYLQTQSEEINARFQLLSYQAEELNALNVEQGEVERLEDEQKQLANVDTIRQNCEHIIELCNNDDNGLNQQLHRAIKLLASLSDKPESLNAVESLFQQALIQVQEAQSDLERSQDSGALDPEQLPEIEARLSAIYEVARKHRVDPPQLYQHHETLNAELEQLQSGDAQLEQLEHELETHQRTYTKHAQALTLERQKSAKKLSSLINKKLSELAMEHARFEVELESNNQDTPHAQGNESIQFLISTSPGQAPKPLGKIASGGELSRISLAIQVVTAQTSTTPTLVFDEVDVGIGGTTGDIVGRLLRELGQQAQILCVTHLAQVASKAHSHLRIEKAITKNSVNSSLQNLDKDEKILEIARMMGGSFDSEQSLAHAKEMLTNID